MKKTYIPILFALFLLITTQTSSGQITNGGFENWITTGSYVNPQSWDSPNTETTAIPIIGSAVLTKSSGAHTGSWCARLETKNLLIANVPGVMVTGQMEINIADMTATISGGVPCSQQVPKITGYFKYAPLNGDTCGMVAFFTKHNLTGGTDTIGFAFFSTNSVESSWTPFEAEVSWSSIENPDTVRILVASSLSLTSAAGSVLYVDDLALDFSSGVTEPLMPEQTDVFFNAANNAVEIHLELLTPAALSVNIYNISGQVVSRADFGIARQINTAFNIDHLPAGMYFVEVQAGNDRSVTKIVR